MPLDEASVQRAAGAFAKAGVESVAVVFLHSYASPGHEQRAAELLRERGFFVSASHEVLPEHREYERASTTALNAYVSPVMQRYLRRLSAAAAGRRAGVPAGDAVQRRCHRRLGRGPVGRAHHPVRPGRRRGGRAPERRGSRFRYIITLDMGGTSTDVSLLPGELKVTTESEIEGYPVRVPVLDIHTVGQGAAPSPGSTRAARCGWDRRAPGRGPGPPATAGRARRSP